MSEEVEVLPSLAGGSLADWSENSKRKARSPEWKMTPTNQGIEAFLGKVGISGNWLIGYVLVDQHRRPFGKETFSLDEAIRRVETEGESLSKARYSDEDGKEK